ncbi:hypothetical protein LSO9J_30046 [Candidatus Liberibacter solanacearum]
MVKNAIAIENLRLHNESTPYFINKTNPNKSIKKIIKILMMKIIIFFHMESFTNFF